MQERTNLEERIEAFADTAAWRHTDMVPPLPSGPIPVRPPVELPPPPSEPHPDEVASESASQGITSVTCKY